ncbi:MAG: hypothetical protein GXP27_17005 [Planctomycetes bacterium]|nr:hypothetical protein [Planctomycetota bacterium]
MTAAHLVLGFSFLVTAQAGPARLDADLFLQQNAMSPRIATPETAGFSASSSIDLSKTPARSEGLSQTLPAGRIVGVSGSTPTSFDAQHQSCTAEPDGCVDQSPKPPFLSVTVQGGVWVSRLNGHLQTPAGGQLGTTSSHRPRVEEIGLDGTDWMPLLDARLRWAGKHEIHVSYVWIDRSGADVLQKTLISQAQTFPAGSAVRSHFGLDTLRVGYRPIGWRWDWRGWRLVPEIGVGSAAFSYQLNSSAATGPVDRRYTVGFPYLGFLLEKSLTDRLQFETDFAGAGGINGANVIDSEFRLAWRVAEWNRGRIDFVVGWRGLWFRRHDSQTEEQNDPNIRFGWLANNPWTGLTTSLRIGF